MATESKSENVESDMNESLFQAKYLEFVEDAMGAFPEYAAELKMARELDEKVRLERFETEVQASQKCAWEEDEKKKDKENPGTILPGVTLSDQVWFSLSETTRHAVWEHLRILSICSFMESGNVGDQKPAWMDGLLKQMKEQWESIDMEGLFKKFSTFFSESDKSAEDAKGDGLPFPKLPERFLKGQLAKLAQEIVKDITPEELGISPDKVEECEKNPSRAFHILFSTFTQNPSILQRTIAKIGKRLQQKIASGAIRPQEIAREAEELMKEFSSNSSFVEMMEGFKSAFGMQDKESSQSSARDSSSRLSMVRERLRKKLEKQKGGSSQVPQKKK